MRFAFNEDQRMLRDTVRDVLARQCPPEVVRRAWEDGSARAKKAWATLGETGVLGMTTGEGGSMDEVDTVLVFEESGYAALPDPLVETMAVGVPLIETLGTDAQKAAWLGKATAGDAVVAFGLQDQPLVAHAPVSDILVLQRQGRFYCVPVADAELVAEGSVDRARTIARVNYEPKSEHLMAEDSGDQQAIDIARSRAIVATSAQLIGLSRRMLDMTVAYAKDREQFGKPIGAQQAVKHRLANALIKQEFARPVVYRAAWSLKERALDFHTHVSMAKVYAAEAAWFVAQQALQVHGAIGYTIECDLHMWMKRAWALAAAYGDPAFHRRQVADTVLE